MIKSKIPILNISHFWDQMSRSFYTLFAMQLVCLMFIIIYFFKPQKEKSILLLFIISLASLIQTALTEAYLSGFVFFSKYFDQKSMYIYLIIELFCCSLYIRENIQSQISKKVVLTSSIGLELYIITYWALHFESRYLPLHIEIIEGFLIIAFCLYYFYELFTQRPDKDLLHTASFWAISGMLILFSAITPLFLFYDYLRKTHYPLIQSLYIINNVSYCLLFITFVIAILCNKKQPTKIIHYNSKLFV